MNNHLIIDRFSNEDPSISIHGDEQLVVEDHGISNLAINKHKHRLSISYSLNSAYYRSAPSGSTSFAWQILHIRSAAVRQLWTFLGHKMNAFQESKIVPNSSSFAYSASQPVNSTWWSESGSIQFFRFWMLHLPKDTTTDTLDICKVGGGRGCICFCLSFIINIDFVISVWVNRTNTLSLFQIDKALRSVLFDWWPCNLLTLYNRR